MLIIPPTLNPSIFITLDQEKSENLGSFIYISYLCRK